jgi:hypothetical protein
MAGVCPPGLREGDSLLSFFRQNIQNYEDYIEVHAGDILQMHWNGNPIEILFLDIVKSWEINNHVIKEFFGHLIPNRSIVVHQDYYHVFCYWIHLTMQYLSPYFQATHAPEGATAGFMLTKEIPKELLEIDYSTFFTKQEAIELMDAALAPLQGIGKLYVMAAKVRLLTHLRDYEAARVLVDQIKQSTKHLPPVLSNELSFAEQEIVTHQLNSIQEAWVQLEQHPSSQNGRARIAAGPDKTTISQSKEEQKTDWKRLAKEQQQLLLHLQQHINFQPVNREMIDRLSSEDISQFIAARKIIKALALKVAAKPGFGWLYKFSGLGKKILEE